MIRSPVAYKSLLSQDRNHRIVDPSQIDEKLKKMWTSCQKQLHQELDKGHSNGFVLGSLSGLNPTSEKPEAEKGWVDWILSQLDFKADSDSPNLESSDAKVENSIGIYHARGRRSQMEDAHIAESFTLIIGRRNYPAKIFGIFDGHGGDWASKYVKEHIIPKLKITLEKLNKLTDAGVWNALKLTFVAIHEDLQRESKLTQHEKEGTTAIISMILGDNLWTANVGDSRAIFVDETNLYQLSEDAKATDPKYQTSIQKRGGFIKNGRINQILAPGRALGDYFVKEGINPRPKITKLALPILLRNKGILMIGCDGIFDELISKQVKVIIAQHQNKTAQFIAKKITQEAFLAGSSDNLSVIIVKLFSENYLIEKKQQITKQFAAHLVDTAIRTAINKVATPQSFVALKTQTITESERFTVDNSLAQSIPSPSKKAFNYPIAENCCEWIFNYLYKQDDKKTK